MGRRTKSAFMEIEESLRRLIQLAFPKEGCTICIHTDASERFLSAVLTHTKTEYLSLARDNQEHSQLAFIGGAFDQTERNWTT